MDDRETLLAENEQHRKKLEAIAASHGTDSPEFWSVMAEQAEVHAKIAALDDASSVDSEGA